MNRTNCVVAIVERGKGEKVMSSFLHLGCLPHLKFNAHGTATNDMLDMFGFENSKRDVVITFGENQTTYALMQEIRNRETVHLHTKGIVFVVAIESLSALLYNMSNALKKEIEGEGYMTSKDALILVSLNQGYSDDVMQCAKQNGARGGTVFKANWMDAGYMQETYNVSFQQEKEVLAIVTDAQHKKDIIESIHAQHGLKTKAQALVITVPVLDKVTL